jgi:6-pyruvoyltetrahydropterin/6-carboxytetrahydropterin synthase
MRLLSAIEPTAAAGPQASFGLRVAKEYHKFSAAHFLIFADGTAERLHGHNYQVAVEVEAEAAAHGVVLDFKVVKSLLSAVLAPLDERFLVPGLHPTLTWTQADGEVTVRYGDRRYVVPADDVCVLPIPNTSAECLARHIATQLAAELRRVAPQLRLPRLAISVEETSGQSGVFALRT